MSKESTESGSKPFTLSIIIALSQQRQILRCLFSFSMNSSGTYTSSYYGKIFLHLSISRMRDVSHTAKMSKYYRKQHMKQIGTAHFTCCMHPLKFEPPISDVEVFLFFSIYPHKTM